MSNPYAPPSSDRAPADRDGRAAGGDPTDPADPTGPAGPGPTGPTGPGPAGPGHPLPPHPAPGPHPPRPHPGPAAPPPSPESLARLGRLARHFSVWLLAGVVVTLLPLPWRFASIAFLVGALVAGVRALVHVLRTGLRGGMGAMLVAGLLVTGLVLVGALGSLVTWRIDADRQACLQGALTRTAEAACERDYDDAVADLTGRLTVGRG
ncbi:hypothetical protein [Cellulomonas pakistanensis]|uniref:Uncharacterized protein n=1 Tax=Cellulomonas pakistanensis TaxID=992287 RepID=A0A919PAX6_9CELL|nr:hypothetical protein [Cellulomonas pakistanensis]GIG35287.1 hypothetical protein Cpa01nite_06680 [Cellulomonas pakistanensis]